MASILILITLPCEKELQLVANNDTTKLEQDQGENIDEKVHEKPLTVVQTDSESEIDESERTAVKSSTTTTTPCQNAPADSRFDELHSEGKQTSNDINAKDLQSKSSEINAGSVHNDKIIEDTKQKISGNEDETDNMQNETESDMTVTSECEDSPEKAVKFSLSIVDEDEPAMVPENDEVDIKDMDDREVCDSDHPKLMSNYSMEEWEEAQPTVQNVKKCLGAHGIKDAIWRTSDDMEYIQVNFVVDAGGTCEEVLQDLTKLGVGAASQTSISMFPATYHCKAVSEEKEESLQSEDSSQMEEFKKSIKSRLLVQEVVESIKGNSKLTFDYLGLIVLASIIAGMGLVENSSVILVASMLISPLMGPIMAGTFGFVIQNGDLRNTGVKLEVIGLAICVLCGIIMGVIFGGVCVNGAVWGSSVNWPTAEMISRGQLRSLWVGIFIALPSGAGVALSILGGNAGSLVGVAISASLLPPAVNAGVFWGNAIIHAVSPPQVIENGTIVVSSFSGLNCLPFVNNEYVPVYSCSAALDFLALGVVSLSLTLINILFIFISSIAVLKIKEVAPHTAASPADQKFWKRDIKVARQSYSTIKGLDSITLKKQFLDELSKCSKESASVNSYNLRHMVQNIADSPDVKSVRNKLGNVSPLHLVWSSDSLAAPRGYPDHYQTVRHRRSQSPMSSVYETITSYYGPNRITHKIIKRAPKLSMTDETEKDKKITQNSINSPETGSVKNKKNLTVKIPKVQFRKGSDANLSRTFTVTTVEDLTDNVSTEIEEMPPTEKDKLM